jgi:hypothetical protein
LKWGLDFGEAYLYGNTGLDRATRTAVKIAERMKLRAGEVVATEAFRARVADEALGTLLRARAGPEGETLFNVAWEMGG